MVFYLSSFKKRCIKAITLYLFILYIAALIYFLFFSEKYGRTLNEEYRYNLIPFSEIKRFIIYYEGVGAEAFMINIIGNIAAFIPFGMLLPVVINNYRRSFIIILDGFMFSLIVETIQLLTKVGSFDVDDVILNTLGVATGYICYRFIHFIYVKYSSDRM